MFKFLSYLLKEVNDSNYNKKCSCFQNDFNQELEEVFTFNTSYNAFTFKK